MAGDGEETSPNRINRREALKRAAIATGVAWSAPVLISLRTPAFAQYGPPCEEGCGYGFHTEHPSFACSECEGNICHGQACLHDCAGPACARVVSISPGQPPDGRTLRFCTDCTLDPGEGPFDNLWCARCPDPSDCTCGGWSIDPSDPRCGLVDDIFAPCPNREIEIYFRCADCTP
jgi:hypothetical protein